MSVVLAALAACVDVGVAEVRSVDPVTIDLGEARAGRLKWISANARFVALYLGEQQPALKKDKTCPAVEPQLVLFDTVRGTREVLEELVAVDPRGRHAVALVGSQLWLLDAETGRRDDLALADADLARDEYRCWGGRQAAFDPWGHELLYFRTAPSRAVVRALASGEEYEVAAPPSPVFRAAPAGEPGWVRFEVEGWELQEMGGMPPPSHCCEPWIELGMLRDRWASPHEDTDAEYRHRDGARHGQYAGPFGRELDDHQSDVESVESLPPGCRAHAIVTSEAVEQSCPAETRLFWPETNRTVVLESFSRWVGGPVRADDGHLWRAAWVSEGHGVRFARISLVDGRIEPAPTTLSFTFPGDPPAQDRHGWLLVKNHWGEHMAFAYDVPTGRTRQIPDAHVEGPGHIVVDGHHFALDLVAARKIALVAAPEAVAENGCALMKPVSGAHEGAGTWSLHCPPDRRLRM